MSLSWRAVLRAVEPNNARSRTPKRAVNAGLHRARHTGNTRRARRIYHRRRDAFVPALLERFEGKLRFRIPPGGTALYARVDPRIDVTAWTTRAAARGLTLFPGARFAFDGLEPGALRLGFARLDDDERAQALDVLAASLPPSATRARGRRKDERDRG